MTVSKRIFLLLLQTTQSLINPAGKFAFAQCVSPCYGLHAFPAFVKEGGKLLDRLRGRRDVKTLQQSGSPAGAEFARQVPIPTRVRRRKSSRLLTFKFSTAYCTSPAVTASHSHTSCGAGGLRSAGLVCDRRAGKLRNRAAERAGDHFAQRDFCRFL